MKTLVTLIVTMLAFVISTHAGERPIIRPLLGFGTLMGAPSADDLGYLDADGGNLDNYMDQKKTSLCVGVQILVPFKGQLSIGGELGFRRLFASTFNTGSSDLDFIDEDFDVDSEHDLSLLGILEYWPVGSKLFLQGGAGLHLVHWSFDSEYSGGYSSSSSSYGGTATNFGLRAAAGIRLPISPSLTMPVMARVDYIMRYSAMLPLSVTAGLEFSL